MSVNVIRAIIVGTIILLGLGLFAVISSLDNSADPSLEDTREAAQDWHDAGPEDQYIICSMWGVSKDSVEEYLKDTNTDEGVIDAKMELVERECDDE